MAAIARCSVRPICSAKRFEGGTREGKRRIQKTAGVAILVAGEHRALGHLGAGVEGGLGRHGCICEPTALHRGPGAAHDLRCMVGAQGERRR